MIKAVFYDLDETLVDAGGCHREASLKAFKKFGLDYMKIRAIAKKKKFVSLGRTIGDVVTAFLEFAGDDAKDVRLEDLYNYRQKLFLKLVDKRATLLPGADSAVKESSRSCEINAIVSSGMRDFINLCIEKFNWKDNIDFIVGEEDIENGKPNPDCYLKAFSKAQNINSDISKSDCLVVEDSVNGAKAAKKAGIKVLRIPLQNERTTFEADYQLNSLEDFDIEKLC